MPGAFGAGPVAVYEKEGTKAPVGSALEWKKAMVQAEHDIHIEASTNCFVEHANDAMRSASKTFVKASLADDWQQAFMQFVHLQTGVMILSRGQCDVDLQGEALGKATIRVGSRLEGHIFATALETFERNGKLKWSN